MKITTKILFIFLLLSFFLILPSSSYAAGVHLVQPFILVPKDWKNIETAEDIESYKRVIVSNLRTVQQFYASKLQGKSFNFVTTVEVVYSDKEIAGSSDKEISSIFGDLNSNKFLNFFGNNSISLEENKVKVIWIIGMHTFKGIYAQGGSRGSSKGIAFMPYVDLFNARGDLGIEPQQFSKFALAHELGHAFGLNFAGYGKGHPCTEASLNECVDGTPQPYPPANEWASVMGYAAPFLQFPGNDFNNSLANPEVKKLYQSPFLNPENDPAPEPSLDSGVKVPDFFTFGSEQIVQAGTVYNLFNGDKLFGEQQGKIEFISAIDKITALSPEYYEIKKWDGTGIGVLIKESAESPSTQRRWKLRITTVNGRLWQAEEDIVIQGKDFNKPSLILTAKLLTTCGEGKPVSASVNFSGVSASGDIGTSMITDSVTGKGEVSLQIEDPKEGSAYRLEPLSLDGVPETPKEEVLTLESADIQAGHKIVNINIHYPSCPGALKVSPLPTPTPEETASPLPSVTLQPGPTSTPVPVCPAVADNCVYSQGDKCYSGYTSDTSTCTWINDTCLNPTAGCAYSCGPLVSCPTSASTKPTPIPSSTAEPTPASTPIVTPLATPYSTSEPTPTPVSEPTQILISNYADFRSDNAPGDAGSPTMTINNPSGQTITWKLSTLIPSPTRRVFVRTITGDEYKDYEPLEMRDGEVVSVAGINIQAKMVKRVVKMTISVNGQDQEIDLNDPQEIITRLPGNAGQAQRFSLPFVIEYSNGEVVRSAIGVNYQPRNTNPSLGPSPVSQPSIQPTPLPTTESTLMPKPTETPASACGDFVFKYNECFACNKSRKVLQDSCGRFDNTEINPGTDSACESWCSSSPSPETRKEIVRITVNEQAIDPAELFSGFSLDLPGVAGQPQTFSIPVVIYYSDGSSRPLAYTFRYQPKSQPAPDCTEVRRYNECTACNTSREISQDSCGNYTTLVDSQSDEGCASWCAAPAPEECPETREQYNQCGGTTGLEDERYDPTHTYLITRIKDCQGNILRYEQEDLGDQGQCQN